MFGLGTFDLATFLAHILSTHVVKDLSRVVEADILPLIDAVRPLLSSPVPEVDGDGGHLDGLVLLHDAALAHLPPSVLSNEVVNLGQI